MNDRILIIGGRGKVGQGVTADLSRHTSAEITITGRTPNLDERLTDFGVRFLTLDLDNHDELTKAIADHTLVIHCAGPFRKRVATVLKACIDAGANYLDVSDDRHFTHQAQALSDAAKQAGIVAVINAGVFPGISNSMARLGVEQFDQPEAIHLNYAVSGSGGAGMTVMRTTFLNLLESFQIWVDGQWRTVRPYTDREIVDFPKPFGRIGVYWFELPEALTLQQHYKVKSVTTKFGTAPDYYNHLTWMVANWFPKAIVKQPLFIEVLSQVSHRMTDISDRFSGTGVSVRVDVTGQKNNSPAKYSSTFVHENAANATGLGTGIIAEYMLSKHIADPGVWTVEQILSTELFLDALNNRSCKFNAGWI